jgi:hypothetical protein
VDLGGKNEIKKEGKKEMKSLRRIQRLYPYFAALWVCGE